MALPRVRHDSVGKHLSERGGNVARFPAKAFFSSCKDTADNGKILFRTAQSLLLSGPNARPKTIPLLPVLPIIAIFVAEKGIINLLLMSNSENIPISNYRKCIYRKS